MQIREFQRHALADRRGARLAKLADGLGVSAASLVRLGIGWGMAQAAWTFPMRAVRLSREPANDIVGFRVRSDAGEKWAVKGSREGIFLPEGLQCLPAHKAFIVEGPTDCAALLDLQLDVIGRPSCTGGERDIVALLGWWRPRECVIVRENDTKASASLAARTGAESLYRALWAIKIPTRYVFPPDGIKDAREWLSKGLTAADLMVPIGF